MSAVEDDEDVLDIGKALEGLEALIEESDSFWTKISQPELEEILAEHERHLDGILGGKRALLKFMDMSYLDFAGRNLTQADATGSRIGHASFDDAILRAANLYAADLRFVSFVGADLTRADLRGSCMRGADFTDAILNEADMRDGLLMRSIERGELIPVMTESESATLDKAVLRGADLTGARL